MPAVTQLDTCLSKQMPNLRWTQPLGRHDEAQAEDYFGMTVDLRLCFAPLLRWVLSCWQGGTPVIVLDTHPRGCPTPRPGSVAGASTLA